jgi:hypothetical protein
MLKKVKSKSYKNKLEFSDDLNLIWENCFRYNSTPVCLFYLSSHKLISTSRIIPCVDAPLGFGLKPTSFSEASRIEVNVYIPV